MGLVDPLDSYTSIGVKFKMLIEDNSFLMKQQDEESLASETIGFSIPPLRMSMKLGYVENFHPEDWIVAILRWSSLISSSSLEGELAST